MTAQERRGPAAEARGPVPAQENGGAAPAARGTAGGPAPEPRGPGAVRTLDALWAAYQRGDDPRDLSHPSGDAYASLYLAVWNHALGRRADAAAHAERAARHDPESALLRAACAVLAEFAAGGRPDVYTSAEAFGAFIRGGDNVPLYEAVSAALRSAYAEHRPRRLLDIGVGDGMALLPALTGDVGHVDLVEPAAAMLAATSAALTGRGVPHRTFRGGLEDVVPSIPDARWDLAESTFALQSLPPEVRREQLAWLAGRTERLLLVEFDAAEPESVFHPDWFADCVRRQETCLDAYGEDRDLIARGFIAPVVLGFFTRSERTNWEQGIDAWAAELRAAGFARVARPRALYDYVWRPAYLLEAVNDPVD